eukprot:CAMPEP_0168591798 /NCGR_PEP_ID=MMETSP0420-20121227/7338_1 /TAXON_ID=498008 /ORGANISM="Pessonella sp." /LENGTH=453 /DNA_ID=CAMNT_0008627637 /DNA_START=181 /DNA_END=1541 /DNA_ORIENTATION=+
MYCLNVLVHWDVPILDAKFLVKSATSKKLENDEDSMFTIIGDSASSCDPDKTRAISPLKTVGQHTSDIFFRGFDFDTIPETDLITGIQLRVKSITLNATDGAICQPRDVQLKHDQKHTTGDRAVPYQTFPKQWTYITFGDNDDIWDEYNSGAFAHGISAVMDIGINNEDPESSAGSAQCGVACAELTIEHVPGFDPEHDLRTIVESSEAHKWWYKAVTYDAEYEMDWIDPDFDHSDWQSGRGDFGRKNAHTKLKGDPHVAFFRTEFELKHKPTCFRALRLITKMVAGGRIWLNGHLLWENNMHPSHDPTITHMEAAVRESSQKKITVYIPETALLLKGRNVLAADVHELNEQDADGSLRFDITIHGISESTPECALPTDPPTPAPPTTSTQDASASGSRDNGTPASENVKARSGDGSLTGGAVAALVFAVLFCLVGVGALYYTTCRKRPVLKI